MRLLTQALTRAVKARGRELGFDKVAIGPADRPTHADAFERWLAAGYAGTMDYLGRTRAERIDPDRLLPGARSVVALALNYTPRPDSGDDWAPVARYARGRDYHDVLRPRLRSLAAFIDDAAASRSRAAVDTSAVLERDLAARAGLGWIGKNTNLLAPELGSYFFIGIVLTTAVLEPDGEQPDRCGSCTACLQACPTGAFAAPYVLDARRCLSYLTIEHRGDIAPDLAGELRDWVFGCDVCQEVCPWTRKAPPTREAAMAPARPLGPLVALLELDDASFRARFRSSAMARAKRSGLVRNVALALGARGERSVAPALRRRLADDDPVVRRAAAWALARLQRVADVAGTSLAHANGGSRRTNVQRARSHAMAENEREFTPQPGSEPERRPMSEEQPRRERNDQESGEPVQLDPEEQPGPGQPQPGQPRPEQPPGPPQPGQPGQPGPRVT